MIRSPDHPGTPRRRNAVARAGTIGSEMDAAVQVADLVRWVEEAKMPETRAVRIEKTAAALRDWKKTR
jgi:uncharacterized protein YdeI (YjbR/CyaY-like superfamily)